MKSEPIMQLPLRNMKTEVDVEYARLPAMLAS